MQDWNQYMNHFLETVTNDTVCERCKDIPTEVGNMELGRKSSPSGILYFDWNMNFHQKMDVSRRGNFGKDEIQMIFNLNQDIEWQIEEGGQLVQLKKGEVSVYRNCDYTTSMTYQGEQKFLFKSIQIPTKLFCSLLTQYFPKEQVKCVESLFLQQITKTAITKEMYQVLCEIDYSAKYKEFESLYLEGKMIELIALVLHSISYYETQKVKRLVLLSEEEKGYLYRIKERIDKQPALEYTTEQLAMEAGMSVSKFNKAFRQNFGESLHAYVIQRRMALAASLLQEGKYNISEVAGLSGYSNLSHFSDSFRKKYGVLPKKYVVSLQTENEKC